MLTDVFLLLQANRQRGVEEAHIQSDAQVSRLLIQSQQIVRLLAVNGVFVPLCEGVTVTCLWRDRNTAFETSNISCNVVMAPSSGGTLQESYLEGR